MKSWVREKIIFPLFLKLMGSEASEYLEFNIVIGSMDEMKEMLELLDSEDILAAGKVKPSLTLLEDEDV